MRNRILKKMLAGMLTATLVLGMSVTAFAADTDLPTDSTSETGSGTATGNGNFEGHVDQDVIKVSLPTTATSTFAFTMDPEGLIEKTEQGAYGSDYDFEDDATVFFLTAEKKYESKSNKIKVTNKGTVPIEVIVKTSATVATGTGEVSLASDSAFTGLTDKAALYLQLHYLNATGAGDTYAIAEATRAVPATDSTGVSVYVAGNPDNYEIQYTKDENGDGTENDPAYVFGAKSGVPDTAWSYTEFYLSGACNPDGDWSKVETTGNSVQVTWEYKKLADTSGKVLIDNDVAEAAPTFSTGDVAGTIKYTNGAGDLALASIESIKMTNQGTAYDGYNALNDLWADASDSAGVITFDSKYLAYYTAGATIEATVTYKNAKNEEKTATVNVLIPTGE